MSGLSVHAAAQNNQLPLLRTLLAEDPKLVNSVDVDGRTPLHWAASSGSIDIARFLIDQKAEVDKTDSSGWTPLHIAVSAGHENVVQELIGAGADVNRKNDKGLTPLYVFLYPAPEEPPSAVVYMIFGFSTWHDRHYAASKSRIDIGRLLISRGADYNARDNANQLPLHRAATTGSVGFIRLLLESSTPNNKLRLNTADRVGNTPLHLAMDSAHAEAAVVLINAGADRTRENLEGETPEAMAGVEGQEQKLARQYVIDHCGKA